MRITELNIEPLLGKAKISFLTDDLETVNKLYQIDPKKPLNAKIEPCTYKRSLNANSYMWVLCDEIAKTIHSTKEDVYRKAIREVGVWQDVACTLAGLPTLVDIWTSRGLGWLVDTFDSKLEGCKRVRLYTGSHNYDTKQMARLIDYIVGEAKELGIETMTPDELAQMIGAENGTSL